MKVDVPDDALQYLQFEPVEETEVPDIPSLPPARRVAIYESDPPVRVILRATDGAAEEYLERFVSELRVYFEFVSQDELGELIAESGDEPLEVRELAAVYEALGRAELLLSRQSSYYRDSLGLLEQLHDLMARVREAGDNLTTVEYGPMSDEREIIALEFDLLEPIDEVYGLRFVIDPTIAVNDPMHLYSHYSSSGWASVTVEKTEGNNVVAYLIPDDISANNAAEHEVFSTKTFSFNNKIATDFVVHVYPGPSDAKYRLSGMRTVEVAALPDQVVR